jgi:hypothetical protein
MKQSSLDEPNIGLDFDPPDQSDDEMREIEERRAMEEAGELPQPPSPRPMTPVPTKGKGKWYFDHSMPITFLISCD